MARVRADFALLNLDIMPLYTVGGNPGVYETLMLLSTRNIVFTEPNAFGLMVQVNVPASTYI